MIDTRTLLLKDVTAGDRPAGAGDGPKIHVDPLH
jgi:hypothetical protein